MDLNATLIGQMITFAIFVFFTMKYVWPPIADILKQRQDQIAKGLAAAEKSERDYELMQVRIQDEWDATKKQAAEALESAHRQANTIIEEAKNQARHEGARMLEQANQELALQVEAARLELFKQVGGLAVAGAERIVDDHLDAETRHRAIDKFINEFIEEA